MASPSSREEWAHETYDRSDRQASWSGCNAGVGLHGVFEGEACRLSQQTLRAGFAEVGLFDRGRCLVTQGAPWQSKISGVVTTVRRRTHGQRRSSVEVPEL